MSNNHSDDTPDMNILYVNIVDHEGLCATNVMCYYYKTCVDKKSVCVTTAKFAEKSDIFRTKL